jgi:WD40 repeat protein
MLTQLDAGAPACYAVAVREPNIIFSCCSDGNICVWDLRMRQLVQKFSGHVDGASCADLTGDATKLVTGGLDKAVRVWELRQFRQLEEVKFPAQLFSLGVCPSDNWVAVGLENSTVEVFGLECQTETYHQAQGYASSKTYQLSMHTSAVLSLKYGSSGKWFVTTGKDNLMTSWRSPYGYSLFRVCLCRGQDT